MRALVIAVALASLAACSHTDELAVCKGPAFALNAGRWQATLADLKMVKLGNEP